jgi:hypothetical protein
MPKPRMKPQEVVSNALERFRLAPMTRSLLALRRAQRLPAVERLSPGSSGRSRPGRPRGSDICSGPTVKSAGRMLARIIWLFAICLPHPECSVVFFREIRARFRWMTTDLYRKRPGAKS